MQHARLKRLATSLEEANPFYKSGMKPSAVNGRFHQLENVVDDSFVFSSRPFLTKQRSLRNRTEFQITPQINHQSSGHRHNADPPHPGASTGEALLVPLAQFAVRLQAQPTPGISIASFRTRPLPARLMPCSRILSPLLYGVGVSPTAPATSRRF